MGEGVDVGVGVGVVGGDVGQKKRRKTEEMIMHDKNSYKAIPF